MFPLVTVGVAVYNIAEDMLRECLDSVVSGTDESCEVIIVDDCSQNGSYEICKEYADKYPRIELIGNERNSGIGRVRNLIIEKAHGEWLYFADGDDLLAPGAAQSAALAADADVIIYDFKSFYGECAHDGIPFSQKHMPLTKEQTDNLAIACLAESPCDIAGHTVSKGCTAKGYRRQLLLDKNIRFIEDLKISEDSVFFADTLCRCNSAVYFPFTLYYYRATNEDSVTNRYNPHMAELRRLYLKYFNQKCNEYFANRDDLKRLHDKYKIPSVIYRQFRLDTFHKDNPKPYGVRKREFGEFLAAEPYKTALENFDCENCAWHERALIFKLAKAKNFFALNAVFKHPFLLKIYGGLKNRLG